MQETINLRECCKVLKMELIKVTSECDTLKMMFEQLSMALQKQEASAPSNITSNPKRLAELYPDMRFWTLEHYNKWTNSPAAHADPHYKFAFLENEQGKTLSDGLIKIVRKLL
ncbi:hypothetical protein JVT61DRAFT_3669 [Boletus reticuloceps]|uniref:Uncharacterized protein n=1 Tax=Boletus reticuloceps TaxID=495285 RepID=A0A8I2YN67_9AGAM|nr:hypothetical protein JVT61DRAFT_3669 [Boletus reticuloceps]